MSSPFRRLRASADGHPPRLAVDLSDLRAVLREVSAWRAWHDGYSPIPRLDGRTTGMDWDEVEMSRARVGEP